MASEGGGVEYKKRPFWQRWTLFWTADGAEHFKDWFDGWDTEPVLIGALLLIPEVLWMLVYDPGAVAGVLAIVVAISPIWLPIYLFNFFWTSWIHYIRFMWWFNLKYVLLKIELPAEVTKSPLAMELFLAGIYNTGGESNIIARAWEGKFRNVFSLEIASNEGRVDFYLRVSAGWRNIIEAKLYGQYPEAKVTEVEDYTNQVPFNTTEYGLWGHEYKKGSSSNALPIKTYIDYQLDKSPDEPEVQVDPMANMLEHMGSIGPGEYLWMQIIFKARKNEDWYGFYFGKDRWQEDAKAELKKITKGAIERAQEFVTDDAEKKRVGSRGSTLLSPGERLKVEAIERSLSKPVFQCGFRTVYIAKKDNFKGGNIGHIVAWYAPFANQGYNTLGAARGTLIFTYPWQDVGEIRENKVRRNVFFQYKHRAYFYVPYDQAPVYMTTEELATIWHFPSSAVRTPALSRVPSRRAEAPPNLPTGNFTLPR